MVLVQIALPLHRPLRSADFRLMDRTIHFEALIVVKIPAPLWRVSKELMEPVVFLVSDV